MEQIKTLLSLDFPTLIFELLLILVCLKYVWELVDWIILKLGIETKGQKSKQETEKLLTDLTDKVNKIDNKLEQLGDRIAATELATKESLADRINHKYKEYLGKNGIPEDEVDEFISLHKAYKGVGGNHTSDIKFNYCMDNLPIIPAQNQDVMDKIKQD